MKHDYRIEICANSLESTLVAQAAGAYRVELCAGMPDGGTTPSYGTIIKARNMLNKTKLNVIIRPRGGDFLYSPDEIDIMVHDIEAARRMGVDGVVFGCLTADGELDVCAMKKLIAAADGLSVTFHRAFDRCANPRKVLEQLIELGVDRVLTSGLEPKAEQGLDLIRLLVEQAAGRIIVMPGSGINAGNISKIAKQSGAVEFHFSGRTSVDGGMIYRNPNMPEYSMVRIDEYKVDVTDIDLVKSAIAALKACE